MKRNEALKFLKKLKKELNSDNEAVEAIDLLLAKAENFDDSEAAISLLSVDVSSDSLEIPAELKNVSEGYALFADGACRGNPGPGSYALIIQNAKGEVVLKSSGVEMPTTNNKMELQGVIRGLHGLFEKFQEEGHSQSHLPVFVYSDSKYVVDGITSWVPGWKSRGWKKADNKEPENLDFWKELDLLKSGFEQIQFIWVKGHAGHPQNELCDKMANAALNDAGF
jgi:ribonuclease HI